MWICNGKNKGGYYPEQKKNSSVEVGNEYKDDIAAAIGLTVVGVSLWWLIKLGASAMTGQWWILVCG